MLRRNKIAVLLVCILTSLSLVLISGCGGGGGSSTTSSATGVEAVGTLVGDRHAVSRSAWANDLNPNYPNAFEVPSTYSVGISKMELLKSENDTTPYVIFDTNSVDNPKTITLTDTGVSESLGENESYPAAGTYSYCRFTLIYQELTINADLGSGSQPLKFRVYSTTSGKIQDGDCLVYLNNTFNWIKGGHYFPISGNRPGDEVTGTLTQHNYLASDETPDPYVFTSTLATPLIIPANPTGKYKVSINLNITKSPEEPNSTGIFMWDDVTADGMFKPAIDKTLGGDGNEHEVIEMGPAEFTPLSPTITFSYTKL
ncbi:MAG: hypothetical protein ABFD64_10210 [Armatimonadota bacterium]